MPASIGVNLRVTGHCKQGGRKYMEDYFSVAYQSTEDEKDLEYAFFGIFDGHGGSEAAIFAKERLMEFIVRQKQFWSDRDEDVLKAIREGFITTHMAMLKEQEKWPKTASGLPSTAGTTASIAFIKRGRIFTGHVGDSGIILGYQNPGSPNWEARRLTKDHKPESRAELQRIEQSGGKVVSKSGVPRVVWYRPQIGHKGPITRSTPFDEIPFLAVARSLGDLWSYNSINNEFVVSPEPDTNVIPIDTNTFRCLIFGTDGLWNMISASTAISIIQATEQHNEIVISENPPDKSWINPSMNLVEQALDRWSSTRMRADNTSVVTLMLDPPGPPRSQVIRNARKLLTEQQAQYLQPEHTIGQAMPECPEPVSPSQQFCENQQSVPMPEHPYPATGLQIVTRYEDQRQGSVESSSDKPRYTEEYLDKLHQEFYASMLDDVNTYWEENSADSTEQKLLQACHSSEKPSCSKNTEEAVETIQDNVVSSSSDKKREKAKKKSRKSTNQEPEAGASVTVNTGVKVSTSTKVNSVNKLKVPSKCAVSLESKEHKQRERRCRSLGAAEVDSSCIKTRNKITENSDKQARSVKLQNTRITRSERTVEKCDTNFKRSKSLGPCDIKHQDIHKIPPENTTNKKMTRTQHLKSKNSQDLNSNFHDKCRPDLSLNKVSSSKITKRSRLNKTLDKPTVDSDEENLTKSRLTRSRSLGDLLNVSTPVSKNKSKSKISCDRGYENISFEKSVKRSQSLRTKDVMKSDTGQFTSQTRTRSKALSEVTYSGKKTRSNTVKQAESKFESYERRSKSLGPKDLANVPLSSGVRTRSFRTPERSSLRLQASQSTPRPTKRDRTDSDEENIVLNAPKMKRSRSLGPHEDKQTTKKSNDIQPKQERNIEKNSDLSATNFKRSRSLGPRDLPPCDYMHTVTRSRSRPPKRERNESDEENTVLSAPKFKRSRSLGPRDLRSRDTFVERNLRERNVLTDSRKDHLSYSDITFPNTRNLRNRRLPN